MASNNTHVRHCSLHLPTPLTTYSYILVNRLLSWHTLHLIRTGPAFPDASLPEEVTYPSRAAAVYTAVNDVYKLWHAWVAAGCPSLPINTGFDKQLCTDAIYAAWLAEKGFPKLDKNKLRGQVDEQVPKVWASLVKNHGISEEALKVIIEKGGASAESVNLRDGEGKATAVNLSRPFWPRPEVFDVEDGPDSKKAGGTKGLQLERVGAKRGMSVPRLAKEEFQRRHRRTTFMRTATSVWTETTG